MHELIDPVFSNQESVLENAFKGMVREPFTYADYEETRIELVNTIRSILNEDDKRFLISFKEGEPDWTIGSFHEFTDYPSVRWKLQNIITLKNSNPVKHQSQLNILKQILNL